MIEAKVSENSLGIMVIYIKADLKKEREQEMGHVNILLGTFIQEIGLIIKNMD